MGTPSQPGMTPRAVQDMFALIRQMAGMEFFTCRTDHELAHLFYFAHRTDHERVSQLMENSRTQLLLILANAT